MMPFAATWMDLDVITLSEVTQKDNNKYYIISLIYKSKMYPLVFTDEKMCDEELKQSVQCQGLYQE